MVQNENGEDERKICFKMFSLRQFRVPSDVTWLAM
jgi:hypothetical protein